MINLQNPVNVSQIRVLKKACRHASISWTARRKEEFSCRENNSMERSSAWEADIRSADQKLPPLQCNPKAHFHIRNKPPWSLFWASSILSTSSYSIYLRTKLRNKWTLFDSKWEIIGYIDWELWDSFSNNSNSAWWWSNLVETCCTSVKTDVLKVPLKTVIIECKELWDGLYSVRYMQIHVTDEMEAEHCTPFRKMIQGIESGN
jgi:hypothetical protein